MKKKIEEIQRIPNPLPRVHRCGNTTLYFLTESNWFFLYIVSPKTKKKKKRRRKKKKDHNKKLKEPHVLSIYTPNMHPFGFIIFFGKAFFHILFENVLVWFLFFSPPSSIFGQYYNITYGVFLVLFRKVVCCYCCCYCLVLLLLP